MTLSDLMKVYDQDALAALSSVGVVRRAVRDAEGGKGQILSVDEQTAVVDAGGHQVTLVASGLDKASCPCPASGICRHIVLAVLTLRLHEVAAPSSDASTMPEVSAQHDLTSLTEAELRKFAGADWDKAVTLARISTRATVSQEGANLTVTLPDVEMPVVFLAGQGLASAAFKGAKTTKRRVVSAAAMVVRGQTGAQSIQTLQRAAPEISVLQPDFLLGVLTEIEALVTAVFRGGSVIAEDAVFDLSISARAQAAPRLTALLRGVVRQARQARTHHFDFAEDRFLADAALTCALIHALQSTPEDSDLTGVVRRTYREVDPLDLLVMSAVAWTAESGARGLRVHAFDLANGSWTTSVQARSAGMDPDFTPVLAYSQQLWGTGTARNLVGRCIQLSGGKATRSAQLAWDAGQAHPRSEDAFVQALQASGVVHTNWAAARSDMAARMKAGLRHVGASTPIVLHPAKLSELGFDDQKQRYLLSARDNTGGELVLTAPQVNYAAVDWMIRAAHDISALVCEARVTDMTLEISPVTVLFAQGSRSARVQRLCNLTLEAPTALKPEGILDRGQRMLQRLTPRRTEYAAPLASARQSFVQGLCSAIFDAVAQVLRFSDTTPLDPLITRTQNVNLRLLSDSLERFKDTPNAANALRVSYLCTEALTQDVMRG